MPVKLKTPLTTIQKRPDRLTGTLLISFKGKLCFFCALLAMSISATAFEDLTAVQTLVYETPHLKNTRADDVVSYHYAANLPKAEALADKVEITITAEVDDERRDVTLAFLTAERRMHLPDFAGYRGNPIIIAMLEHLAQSLGRDTGGGVLYFRNRIRDALASEETSETSVSVKHNDTPIDATRILLKPFLTDQNLAEYPEYKAAEIVLLFSESVSGGVVSIGMQWGEGGEHEFSRTLTLL